MKDYTIAITTFSKRFDMLENLVGQIRGFSQQPIILVINGEKDGKFNEQYRRMIITLCTRYNDIYPNIFIETRGLSKLWNTALINSYHENVLMLNDDIEIKTDHIFKLIEQLSDDYNGLTKFNGSFSHFIVNKTLMSKIGYFDERLLGFGEEDGDITYRLLEIGIQIKTLYINGLINIVSNIRHDNIKSGIGKYSLYNREFIYKEKYKEEKSSKLQGLFDTPMIKILDDNIQYTSEQYFQDNKNKLYS